MNGTITRKTGSLHVHVFGLRPVCDKLINFLDSQLQTRNSRLDPRNYRRSSIESRGTVNLLLSGTVRACHPNADSYKDLTPEQVYRLNENEKKRMYKRRVLEVEEASFMPLVFTTTGGMGRECLTYHSRLAELISIKKGEDDAKTLTWIRGKVTFSILSSALLCIRGSRSNRRRTNNVKDIDADVELVRSNVK